METTSPQEIAKVLGVKVSAVRGTQNWQADTHDHYIISELVVGEDVIPFRVKDATTGECWTKLPNDPYFLDAKKVDVVFAEVMALQVLKNAKVFPAMCQAVPDLEPNGQASLVELKVGGKDMRADLVDGKIVNIREPVVMPKFSVSKDGKLVCDVSVMHPDHQTTIKDALAKHEDADKICVECAAL